MLEAAVPGTIVACADTTGATNITAKINSQRIGSIQSRLYYSVQIAVNHVRIEQPVQSLKIDV